VVVLVLLIAGLFFRPDPALRFLWMILIPILPASFLVVPELWRALCPLATLNMLPHALRKAPPLPPRLFAAANTIGMVLLILLVPARRFAFNENGAGLAAVIIAVGLLALVLGVLFEAKSGFCNAICPVLPVERLYGQHPFFRIHNPRCRPCASCTPKGCIEVVHGKSFLEVVDPPRHGSSAWLKRPHGVFAAAFPGFIVGYYTTTDAPLEAAPSIYLHVLVWAVASFLLTVLMVRILKATAAGAVTTLAALAVGIYYWFAAPLTASALGLSAAGTITIRCAAFALIALWLWRARRRLRERSTTSQPTNPILG
jgi:nitrite reductase (NADH) large subunit